MSAAKGIILPDSQRLFFINPLDFDCRIGVRYRKGAFVPKGGRGMGPVTEYEKLDSDCFWGGGSSFFLKKKKRL